MMIILNLIETHNINRYDRRNSKLDEEIIELTRLLSLII